MRKKPTCGFKWSIVCTLVRELKPESKVSFVSREGLSMELMFFVSLCFCELSQQPLSFINEPADEESAMKSFLVIFFIFAFSISGMMQKSSQGNRLQKPSRFD